MSVLGKLFLVRHLKFCFISRFGVGGIVLTYYYLQIVITIFTAALVTLCSFTKKNNKMRKIQFARETGTCVDVTFVVSRLSLQIRIAALNASSTIEDDYEGTFKSHKTQTKEAQVSKPTVSLREFCLNGSFVISCCSDCLTIIFCF